jgi:hypothetical protein
MNRLAGCAGQWQGTSTLFLPDTAPENSDSILTVVPELNGRFIRLDYTWSQGGAPQHGSLLIGSHEACWIDTWHMTDRMMLCATEPGDGPAWSCRGSYAASPGPDWNWRIAITPDLPGKLRIVMTNIPPAEETGVMAVDAQYSRIG